MAMAAIAVLGMDSMRPITAAASIRIKTSSPVVDTVWKPPNPSTGVWRRIATVDRTAATIQMMVSSRGTGTPSRVARPPFSLAALIASPYLDRRMKTARAATMITVPTKATMSFPENTTGLIVNWVCNGVLNVWWAAAVEQEGLLAGLQNRIGKMAEMPANAGARPIVATVRISRELRRKCRGKRLRIAPMITAATIPIMHDSTKLMP